MNVLIVDDHEIVRDGLSFVLKDAFPIQKIHHASDGREALKIATNHPVDVVLLDLSMPNGLDGLLTLQELRKILPDAKIIIFSIYDEFEYQKKAFQYGADGYLVKRLKSDEIVKAIRQIIEGKNDRRCSDAKSMDAYGGRGNLPFTPRELETFILTVKGFTQKEIAETMHISIRTVENHRRNISKKLGTKTNGIG